jgi:hypothetical protein
MALITLNQERTWATVTEAYGFSQKRFQWQKLLSIIFSLKFIVIIGGRRIWPSFRHHLFSPFWICIKASPVGGQLWLYPGLKGGGVYARNLHGLVRSLAME